MKHRPHLHRRTFVVSLLAAVALCFLCAVCHQTQAEPLSAPAVAGFSACPDEAGPSPADTDPPSPEHHCETSEGQVLPSGQSPLLLGAVLPLTPFLRKPPARGPAGPTAHPRPSPPHGFTLLTRLCVQRV
ncbi:hypothetical protein [Nocardiopsis salina]|uniref:hypothetical protein n=1 Tax=Nocardiopsis salina TaxID=245836 RepID=UPI00034A9416|nr:hypothetical protein [Nocardiopsis salina]